MRALILSALIAAASTAAIAQPQPNPPPNLRGNPTATLCLDPNGVSHAPVCRSQNASRLPTAPDICSCNGPQLHVDADWCAPGERPPADTLEFNLARAKFARENKNSIIGMTFEGRRACVPLGPTGR